MPRPRKTLLDQIADLYAAMDVEERKFVAPVLRGIDRVFEELGERTAQSEAQ